jgi:hypothetical protein
MPVGEPDSLVDSKYVKALFGGRSDMWIWRHTPPNDSAEADADVTRAANGQ